MFETDPRLQTGAYITDGTDLYEVLGIQRGPGSMGVMTKRMVVENCRNLRRLEFFPEKISESFALVRPGPMPHCPDVVQDIGWGPDAEAEPLSASRG